MCRHHCYGGVAGCFAPGHCFTFGNKSSAVVQDEVLRHVVQFETLRHVVPSCPVEALAEHTPTYHMPCHISFL